MDQERDWKSKLDRDRDSLRALEPGLPFPGPGAAPGEAAESQQQPAQAQAAAAAKILAEDLIKKWLIAAALAIAPWIIGGILIVFFIAVILVATLKTACKGWVTGLTISATTSIDCSKWK
ncbi:hypothetical protein HY633_00395 [Candidatus Uhrbacteria bacterium]|nr:hypothetical protein [Candidatus Uhrbacteria bacterium]